MKACNLTCLIVLLFAGVAAGAQQPGPNDEARFLAGLPVRGTQLEPLSHSQAWAENAVDFDNAWADLVKHQLQPITAWGPGALGHFYSDTGPVLYFFSGPDFLYAHALFPQASTYVLCGIEPIGSLPQVESIPPDALGPALESLRDSLDTVFDFGFFITHKMRPELQSNRISGTLPLLYIFLARSGCTIHDVTLTGLDKNGQFTTGHTLAPFVRITFSSPGGKEQMLYYFSSDLSDDTFGHSGLVPWCASLGPSRGFLKAASYLMHTGGFDTCRQFLLTDCQAILQDDSGIPMRYFGQKDWSIRLLGAYHGPIATFKQFPQQELVDLTASQKPAPLPFGIGYRWHPGESSLIFATKVPQPATPIAVP